MVTGVPRSLAAVSVVALVSFAGAGHGQQTPASQPPAREPGQRQPGPDGGPGRQPGGGRGQRAENAEGAMKAVRRALNQLEAQITDPAKKDDNLRLIGEMERGLVTAKNFPLSDKVTRGADEAAKAKLAATYRTRIIAAVRTLLDMEEDVAAGRTDAAKAKFDALQSLRDKAHDEMGVKED